MNDEQFEVMQWAVIHKNTGIIVAILKSNANIGVYNIHFIEETPFGQKQIIEFVEQQEKEGFFK